MRLSLLSAVVVCALTCTAQQSSDIAEVAGGSGIIFRGTVLAIAADTPRAPGEMAVTRVTFRVEDAIRGTTTGATLTIRQWSGAADEYRIGESLALFLYAPSGELGLTSPVGGRAGHRRVEDIPADVWNGLRSSTPTVTTPSPGTNTNRRPGRPARGGSR